MAGEQEDDILTILTSLGMEELYNNFKDNRVGPKEVEGLGSDEFSLLGVMAIGDRVRLKQACRNHVRGEVSYSPSVQRFLELNMRGKKRQKTTSKEVSKTRKIHVGWKHCSNPAAGAFTTITAGKGGGTQIIDIDRNLNLEELHEIICGLYFPGGKSDARQLHLTDVRTFLANYTGAKLQELISDESFTVERYCQSKKTNPIRIYLHTVKIDSNSDGKSKFENTDNKEECKKENTDNGESKIHVDVASSTCNETTKLDLIATGNGMNTHVDETEDTSDDDFIDLGTPTVQLNRRQNMLSLSRNKSSQSEHTVQYSEPGTSKQKLGASDTKCYVVETDSDSEFQEAICESLRPKPTFEEALQKWRSSNIEDSSSEALLLIQREKLLESVKRGVTRKSFSFTNPVKISFTGEDGEDYGGLKREFFSLLMKELKVTILENGILRHSTEKLESKEYFQTGRYITWSILNGGPGFPFMKCYIVGLLLDQTGQQFNINDAYQEERNMLEKLQNSEEIDEELSDWLIEQGLSPPFHIEKKSDLVNLCLKQFLYYRIHAEICQLRDGLNSFNFLNSMMEYPSGLESLLCDHQANVTFEQAKNMIQINFSEDGSNFRRGESNTVYSFETFLQDCIDHSLEVSFEDLLSFWTGADRVPPLGFDKKLEINFVNGPDKLPVAHTCEMSLELARGLSPEDFCNKMVKAIQWGGEFHLA